MNKTCPDCGQYAGHFPNCPNDDDDSTSMITQSLLAGKTPKEFAHEAGISVSWAYRLAWEAGFKSIYISREEQKLIAKRRAK